MKLFEQFVRREGPPRVEDGASGTRPGTFAATAFYDGGKATVLGTTVGREGLTFVSPARLAEGELRVRFTLRERPIEAQVLLRCGEPVAPSAALLRRYVGTFTAIADADWDAVVRYVESVPEPPASDPHGEAAPVCEEFRSLPVATQQAILAILVDAGRLDPPAPGREPSIRVSCGAVRRLGDGRLAREVAVRTNVSAGEHAHEYESRVRLYSGGAVDLLA